MATKALGVCQGPTVGWGPPVGPVMRTHFEILLFFYLFTFKYNRFIFYPRTSLTIFFSCRDLRNVKSSSGR